MAVSAQLTEAERKSRRERDVEAEEVVLESVRDKWKEVGKEGGHTVKVCAWRLPLQCQKKRCYSEEAKDRVPLAVLSLRVQEYLANPNTVIQHNTKRQALLLKTNRPSETQMTSDNQCFLEISGRNAAFMSEAWGGLYGFLHSHLVFHYSSQCGCTSSICTT